MQIVIDTQEPITVWLMDHEFVSYDDDNLDDLAQRCFEGCFALQEFEDAGEAYWHVVDLIDEGHEIDTHSVKAYQQLIDA